MKYLHRLIYIYVSDNGRKKKKTRTTFSRAQVFGLERKFATQVRFHYFSINLFHLFIIHIIKYKPGHVWSAMWCTPRPSLMVVFKYTIMSKIEQNDFLLKFTEFRCKTAWDTFLSHNCEFLFLKVSIIKWEQTTNKSSNI